MDAPSTAPAAGLPPRRPRVAVIAVHGVADQEPGDTVTTISGLFANLQTSTGAPAYAPFRREEVRIPVRRLDVPAQVASGRTFAQRAHALRTSQTEPPDVGFEFMKSVLANYEVEGPEETFDTTVLSSERLETPADPAVDVYEMYWADLSRLTRSAFQVFAEIYQLLFHLGSLGVHAVCAAQISEMSVGSAPIWSAWAVAQRFAANAIALCVLFLNLLLFGLALVMLGQTLLLPIAAPVVLAVAGLFVAVAVGVLTYFAYIRTRRLFPFALVVLLASIVLVVVAAGRHAFATPSAIEAALATQLWFIVASIVGVVMRLYDRHRPGAIKVAVAFGVPATAWLLVDLWRPGAAAPLSVLLEVGALGCIAMASTWVAFFIAGWIAFLLGQYLMFDARRKARQAPSEAAREEARCSVDRIRRSDWTARITVAVPAALFVMATTLVWAAVWTLTRKQMTEMVTYTPLLTFFRRFLVDTAATGLRTSGDLVGAVIDTSAGWGFGVLMGCVAAAFVLGLYALLPAVLDEVFPPKRTLDGTALGRWLDDGFRFWTAGGHLVWLAVFVVLPGGFVALSLLSRENAQAWAAFNVTMLTYVSAALLPVGAGLMAFSNRFKALTLGVRNVVDAALDVDNHLREHPLTAAPRARIAARYASLLRHVYRQGYSRIVIIAHSQGTVITADFLRYVTTVAAGPSRGVVADICARPDCPIAFFTMGSPLRQLYGLRFPHLYRWARHMAPGPCEPSAAIPPGTDPDPRPLGITQWVNGYRSGDYIGRYLWRPDGCVHAYATPDADLKQPWVPALQTPPSTSIDGHPPVRAEFCIGSGAHTHYWDHTAPAIAITLDQLVTNGGI